MKVEGKRTEYNVKIEVEPIEMAKSLRSYLGFGEDYFIKDGKVYECRDVGYHKADYRGFLITDNPKRVREFEIISELISIIKSY